MNPQFKKKEIKYFKNLVEIQLGITKVVLEEHKKHERKPFESDCDIKILEKVQEIQQRRIDLCNTTLGIRKKKLEDFKHFCKTREISISGKRAKS